VSTPGPAARRSQPRRVGGQGSVLPIDISEGILAFAEQTARAAGLTNVTTRVMDGATPGVFRPAYFQDLADILAAAAGSPPDPAAIGAVMRHHGLTPAQPCQRMSLPAR
jgi:hypothetical protein